jgi:hypothetical protein
MNAASLDRRRPFVLSAMTDFRADVEYGVYTLELLDEVMGRLRRMGVRRLYWLYYSEYDVDAPRGGNLFGTAKYAPETLDRIGDPVKAAVPLAHKHGIELYGVLWPYDLGCSWTYPEGSPEAGATSVARIGGTLQLVDGFIERYPHLRVRRRPFKAPPDLHSLPIRKIRLLKRDDSPTRIRRENLEIWASPKNYRYQRKDVSFTLKEAVEPAPRDVYDRCGERMSARGAPVRTLTLEGLDLKDRYILIATNFKDGGGDFSNTALGMVEAYGPGPDPLPIEVASRRSPMPLPRDFRTYGLEFDCGTGLSKLTLDMDNSAPIEEGASWRNASCEGVIAFARGKNEYVPSDPCEACPEVRKAWSGWVDRMMAVGVDGIDMRLNSHGIATNEPYEYGFNEPLVEEYGERFGADLLSDDADLELLARLRGEHFTSFVRQTSERVRQAGKKMQMHVHTGALPLRPDPGRGQPFWMPANLYFDYGTWLREGLVDGIVLRSGKLDDPEVEEVLALAQKVNAPVSLNKYVHGALGIDEYVSDLESIFRDERFGGYVIYELQGLVRPAADGSRLIPVEDKMERIQAKAEELGIV